jgi:hypothetical protein
MPLILEKRYMQMYSSADACVQFEMTDDEADVHRDYLRVADARFTFILLILLLGIQFVSSCITAYDWNSQ